MLFPSNANITCVHMPHGECPHAHTHSHPHTLPHPHTLTCTHPSPTHTPLPLHTHLTHMHKHSPHSHVHTHTTLPCAHTHTSTRTHTHLSHTSLGSLTQKPQNPMTGTRMPLPKSRILMLSNQRTGWMMAPSTFQTLMPQLPKTGT